MTFLAQLDLISPSVGFALLQQGQGSLLLSTNDGRAHMEGPLKARCRLVTPGA